MSFGSIIDSILLKPLQLLFEIIYMTANGFLVDPGLSIIVLSLVMNFLVLPLYKRADAMQDEEREMELRLHDCVAHIKKTFSGDERMMMLQTYYRQNNYKPTYVLRGAVSLFLEIPFFMAAYRFLSELQLLEGVAFGPIADLGRPDGMLVIAGVAVNVLPFLMTAINLVSSAIYTKGSPLRSKIQLYAMAVFFLVFLYDSPAGLVFYWTLNNVFSLVKTIFYKLKNPGKVLRVLAFAAGLGLLICGLDYPDPKGMALFAGLGLALMLPLIYGLLKAKLHLNLHVSTEAPNKKVFFAGGVFLALLTGVLIPSAVINASPQEFVSLTYFHHPVWFIVSASCLAFGTFVVWAGVFYWLASPSGKAVFDKVIWILCGCAIVNYMFFGRDLGLLSAGLKFEDGLDFSWKSQLLNLAVLFAVTILLYFVFRLWKKQIFQLLLVGSVALGCMSALNVGNINGSINEVKDQLLAFQAEEPRFTLSTSGENVIIVMLDMAMGEYVPYIFNEKPELKEQFDGFTYYSNVISFGGHTNFGVPALYGGYEYTPYKMNKRDSEPLVSKHNEALKVMPVLFSQNNYQVTVADPPYANYQWIPDLSIYDDYPEIKTYITQGRFDDTAGKQLVADCERNFFCYSILKTIPLCLREAFYDSGSYLQANDSGVTHQKRESALISHGIDTSFQKSYGVLEALPRITDLADNHSSQFILMTNETTHTPTLLQMPDYHPSQEVDNTPFADQIASQYVVDGRNMYMYEEFQVAQYHANMAAMLQLGKWFDYLRQNGVYDNTRIILVSDHGINRWHFDELSLTLEEHTDISYYYPLLMVKDFNNTGFRTSNDFMTNADVPSLALHGIIENPVNPFTGNLIDASEKSTRPQYISASHEWNTATNNGNTFLPATWYSVHDNIWDKDNWKVVAENAILPDAG